MSEESRQIYVGFGNEVDIDDLEVNGVRIEDGTGKVWVVPGDNLEDYTDLHIPDELEIPKRHPDFFYQWMYIDEVGQRESEGWACVTIKEVGLPPQTFSEYGKEPEATVFRKKDMICMKIPKIIAEALQRKQDAEATAVLNSTKPDAKQVSDGVESFETHERRQSSRISEVAPVEVE